MLLEFRLVVFHLFMKRYYRELSLIIVCHSQYLENYLWVNYTEEVSSNAYLMSICCIVNEKFRENVPAWEVSRAKLCRHRRTLTRCQVVLVANVLETCSCLLSFEGVQESARSLPLLLQVRDGSSAGRRRSRTHCEGTNRAPGFPGSLL